MTQTIIVLFLFAVSVSIVVAIFAVVVDVVVVVGGGISAVVFVILDGVVNGDKTCYNIQKGETMLKLQLFSVLHFLEPRTKIVLDSSLLLYRLVFQYIFIRCALASNVHISTMS